MFNMFKYIGYIFKAKQGINAPQELLSDTSFGIIESFFIISFIILGLLTGGALFLGFSYGYIFFKFFGIFLFIVLIIDISLYKMIKRTVEKISSQVTNSIKKKIDGHRTIRVEATEVE